MSDTSEKKVPIDCKEYEKCLEYLHLMLDNEATEAQEKYLKNHLEHCMVCFEQYEVERQIRELLKTKLINQKVPDNLAAAIRTRVFQSA